MEIEQSPSPARVIALLILQLRHGASLLTGALADLSPKEAPTTYQTFRWLGGALTESENALSAVVAAAGLEVVTTPEDEPGFLLLQLPFIIADAEARMNKALESFKLDELPPGNPGEPEFEKALKPKIALNRAVAKAGKFLGDLNNALASPTYKLDSTEDERVAAWREQRRVKCRETITAIEAQEAEFRKALDALAEAKRRVGKDLEETDQMTFGDFDPAKPVLMGDEEAPETNEAAP